MESNANWMSPASSALTMPALPLKGTWLNWAPTSVPNCSTARWLALPLPAEP